MEVPQFPFEGDSLMKINQGVWIPKFRLVILVTFTHSLFAIGDSADAPDNTVTQTPSPV